MKLYAEAKDAVVLRRAVGNLHSFQQCRGEIVHAMAPDAHEVMVMLDIRIVAGSIRQEGDLGDQSLTLQRVERLVDGGQRYGRISLTDPLEDLFGRRVTGRRQERLIDGQPLMRHAQSSAPAMLSEIIESLSHLRLFRRHRLFSLENDS